MANRVEIEIVTTYKPGSGLRDAEQQLRTSATSITADIERIFERSADAAGRSFADVAPRIERDLRGIRETNIDIKVDVDTSEIGEARRELTDLDGMPDPSIDVEIDSNARQAAAEVESTFSGLDFGNVGSSLTGSLTDSLNGMIPVVGAIGAALGESLGAGIGRGMTSNQRVFETQLRTGFGPERSAAIGQAAGAAYGAGFGEQASSTLDAAIALERKLGDIDPSLNLQKATEWATLLEERLGIGVAESAELAGRMIQQGLARNTEEAYDVMVDAAQRYGAQAEEVLDATREFGGLFQKLGIEAPAAIRFIGDSYERGLTSQVERAAEAVEEFNTRITDGDSQEAVERLGFSFEEMQQKLADGRGAEALSEIAEALLTNVDAAERATRANEIFGTSFETTGQIDEFLQLIIELDTAQVNVAGSAEEAAEAAKAATSQWEIYQRKVEDLGSFLGNTFAQQQNQAAAAGEPLRDRAIEIHGALADWLEGAHATDEGNRQLADGAVDAAQAANDFEQRAHDAAQATVELAEEATGATDQMNELAGALNEAKAAADSWADNSGEQALIDLHDAADELSEALDETTAASFSAADGFDLSTEAGRRGAEALAAYRGDIAAVTDAYLSGRISTDQFTGATDAAESALREAAAAAGFTDSQVEALIAEYTRVPGNVQTEITAIGNAWDQVGALLGSISRIPRSVTTTHTIHTQNLHTGGPRAAGGTIDSFEQGGIVAAATGGGGALVPTLVNDGAGVESARMPNGNVVGLPVGSSVITAEDTERMAMESAMIVGGPPVINNFIAGTVLAERDLERIIRDSIYQGGFDGLGGLQ